ncbi:MAG TPA: hypothetical protein VIV61_09775 [Candidatus Ozemobacteraceae bacterium]
MSKWLERARREFSTTPVRPTDNTDERTPELLTSVTSVSHLGKSENSEPSNVSNGSNPSGQNPIFQATNTAAGNLEWKNPAILMADLPDDRVLRDRVHRLLDRADELDRAGDEAGALHILDDIRRTIQNATAATVPDKASRNDGAGKDEVSAVSTSPRASNAESPRKPVPVPVLEAGPAITPPSDHADVVSERAAMVETDAGMNRVDAEAAAAGAVGPCHVCGGGRFWVSRWGVIVCERCHPPADTKLIERNISIHV